MKVFTIFGTHPETIKTVPVIKVLAADKPLAKVCDRSQHRQKLDQVLDLFDISPDFDFDRMKSGRGLNHITSGVLLGTREVYKQYVPDIIRVYSDTTTTLAVGIFSYYAKTNIGHVEAALLSHNKHSLWI